MQLNYKFLKLWQMNHEKIIMTTDYKALCSMKLKLFQYKIIMTADFKALCSMNLKIFSKNHHNYWLQSFVPNFIWNWNFSNETGEKITVTTEFKALWMVKTAIISMKHPKISTWPQISKHCASYLILVPRNIRKTCLPHLSMPLECL